MAEAPLLWCGIRGVGLYNDVLGPGSCYLSADPKLCNCGAPTFDVYCNAVRIETRCRNSGRVVANPTTPGF